MRRIGLIGTGQLGRMTLEACLKHDPFVAVLGPDADAPSVAIASEWVRGRLDDREAILSLGAICDTVSYEIEHVDVDALEELERRGVEVVPSSRVLRVVQDKLAQKEALAAAGVPQPRFAALRPGESVEDLAPRLGGWPVVAKSRRGGYDGRGVAVLPDAEAARDSARLPPGALYAEERTDIAKELAVVVARGRDGSAAAYPCVEMAFDPRANLCDTVIAPARIDADTARRAREVAERAIEALVSAAEPGPGRAGVFAVELFLARDGGVLVNEIAPRPHNSAHFSIEACVTDQFEQYFRILAGLPLGSPELLRPAAMINLVGEPDANGAPEWRGLEEALGVPGVSVHSYGKREVRPFRKMGHLTAIGKDAAEALERATRARGFLRIAGRAR